MTKTDKTLAAQIPDHQAVHTTTGLDADPRGVNHPGHYNAHPSGVECIEVIRYMPHNVGAAWAYMQRLGMKTEPGLTREQTMVKDLDKSCWYLRDEIRNAQFRLEMTIQGQKAMTAIINGEPDLVTSQFYMALAEYCVSGERDNLRHAIHYAQAVKTRHA